MDFDKDLVDKMNFLYSKKKSPKSFNELFEGDVLTRKNIGAIVFEGFDSNGNLICYEKRKTYEGGKFVGDVVVYNVPRELVVFNSGNGSYIEIDKFGEDIEEKVLNEGKEYEKYKSYLISLGLMKG